MYESDTLLQPGRSFLVKDTVSKQSPPTSDTSQEERTAHTDRKSVENCDLSKIFKLSPNLSEVKKQETVTNGEYEESERTVTLRSGAVNSTQVQDIRQDVLKVKEMFPSMEEDKIKKMFDENMMNTEFLEINGVSIVERVIEEMLAFQESVYSEENTASQDVQSALCDLRPSIRNQDSDAYKSQSADLRKKCVPGRKWRKGAFVTSKKGKAPARKPDFQQTSSCNSDENVMELDGCDSASSSSLDFPWEASMDTPSVDQNANGCKEMEFPLLKCVACGATQDRAAVSQCCMDHLICKACVEKQTKKVLSPESKETQIPCPMFGCTTYIPMSQASKVLPSLIMELLEEKINKRAMKSITKMKDNCCPFCGFAVITDSRSVKKNFFCPNVECMKDFILVDLSRSRSHKEFEMIWYLFRRSMKSFKSITITEFKILGCGKNLA
uniref:Uncharacterized protein LOC111132409 isoform X3 n=1 Tax=Crassostrea virginica TaxID=6565 RepID=A0A8B8E8M5_CRAVI|nr:uncharacterized protein LOC111132409 isoform X3 [Crassostrea virginica]